jgi:hypothetical protein
LLYPLEATCLRPYFTKRLLKNSDLISEISGRPPSSPLTNNSAAIGIQVAMANFLPVGLGIQLAELMILAIPVACVAWTATHEEVFREPREYCQRQHRQARTFSRRKFFYVFTCEYCLSHYVAAGFLFISRFQLLYQGWRGYFVALFALVWVANQYMSVYNRLRLDIKHEHLEIQAEEKKGERTERRRAA